MLHLKTRAQFQAVLAGTAVAKTTHFVMHRCALSESNLAPVGLFRQRDVWMGAMVPKRWAKRSVTRHLIKRQVYATATEHAKNLSQAAHVVRLRAAFSPKQFHSAASDVLKQAVREEMALLFERAHLANQSLLVQPFEAQAGAGSP